VPSFLHDTHLSIIDLVDNLLRLPKISTTSDSTVGRMICPTVQGGAHLPPIPKQHPRRPKDQRLPPFYWAAWVLSGDWQ